MLSAEFLAALQAAARKDAELAAFSANANCGFRLVVGSHEAGVRFSSGQVEISEKIPDPAFILEAPAEVWKKFFSNPPPAPYHGIYAMKMRVPEFKVSGSELALAQNMHLVRRVLRG